MDDPLSQPASARRVAFDVAHGATPSALYVQSEERLLFSAFTNNAAGQVWQVSGRLLLPVEGVVPYFQEFAQGLPNTIADFEIPLPECFVLGLTVRARNSSPNEVNWCRLQLTRGTTDTASEVLLHLLAVGLITPEEPIQYPAAERLHAFGARGVPAEVAGTDPAAGSEISETVPTGVVWELQAIAATLVADATVATRQPHLVLDDGGSVYFRRLAELDATAGQTVNYYGSHIGFAPRAVTTASAWALPDPLLLLPGDRIRTLTTNLQAGDNWSAPTLKVRQVPIL